MKVLLVELSKYNETDDESYVELEQFSEKAVKEYLVESFCSSNEITKINVNQHVIVVYTNEFDFVFIKNKC